MDIYPNIYYVYFYLRSKDSETAKAGTPYYVGKGKGGRCNDRRRKIPVPKDSSKIILVEQDLTELQAFILERYYIRWFGRKDNGTGILGNRTNGGEGASGKVYTEEERKLISERSKGPNPKKGRTGNLNGMYKKTHPKEVKKILAECAKERFKGKSYEELYGKEKSDELKKQRSIRFKNMDRSGKNNSRFDFRIYNFLNIVTNEKFTGTRFHFYTKYDLHKGSVCKIIKNNSIYKGWKLVN